MTASPAPTRFTFDLDLSRAGRSGRTLSDGDIESLTLAARSEGYEDGYREGESSRVADAAAKLTLSAETLCRQAGQILARLDTTERQLRAEAVHLAHAIAAKLARGLVARQPEAELQALIAECVASLDRAPHLVIRCNQALADKLTEITEAQMAAAGFSGRLVVMGDPEIAPGDGRLEWADGGLVRDMQQIDAEIGKSIDAYLEAGGATPGGAK
jgi:flagellar assembly protein FliH